MKTFFAALALAVLVTFPAFAQSYDPDLGTGNIAPYSASTGSSANVAQRAPAGFARVPGGFGSAAAAYGAVTPFGTPGAAHSSNHSVSDRDTALRECSTIARRYQQTTWANMEIQQHRTCMAQHGQME